jgi:hypothetical protein
MLNYQGENKTNLVHNARRYGSISGVNIRYVIHATFIDVLFDKGESLRARMNKSNFWKCQNAGCTFFIWGHHALASLRSSPAFSRLETASKASRP